MCVISPPLFSVRNKHTIYEDKGFKERGGGVQSTYNKPESHMFELGKETKYIWNHRFNLDSNGNVDFTLTFLLERILCLKVYIKHEFEQNVV